MNDPFRHLYMPPELACQFLAVFSRAEYALKATIQYARPRNSSVEANWDQFARDIDASFQAKATPEVAVAGTYLLGHPPRKQALLNGALVFVDAPPDPNTPKTEQLLLMVRRVRNNLFHGGKHLPHGELEVGRNELLVSHSLTVLGHCMPLNDDVRLRFDY